jgi:hypothetical protein
MTVLQICEKYGVVIASALVAVVILPFALYFGALFIAYDCNPDFLKIDTCLDAGGRWDYTNRVAVFDDESDVSKRMNERASANDNSLRSP